MDIKIKVQVGDLERNEPVGFLVSSLYNLSSTLAAGE